MTQADIDSASVLPPIAEAFYALTGSDTDGTPVAIATIRLRDTGDERIEDAERKIHELASTSEGRCGRAASRPWWSRMSTRRQRKRGWRR